VVAQVDHLLEHRGTRDVEHAADDDPTRLAGSVGVDHLERPVETHGSVLLAAMVPPPRRRLVDDC
jgi:hypothetical protein